ncbi:MAG: hypothetical protein K0Q60_4702 [Microvirga sp.]|jgi:hypothetical protein|nr:hypothetical protein [Microvirga sp.]
MNVDRKYEGVRVVTHIGASRTFYAGSLCGTPAVATVKDLTVPEATGSRMPC